MTRRMLIDATHPEETRVTVVDGNKLEEFDYETTTKAQLKGNIYLAKVTRVEPSLQAAFVEYGGNRHGFLAFSEIHPDYYRIPVADREDLLEDAQGPDDENGDEDKGNGEPVEDVGGDEAVDEAVEEAQRRRPRLKRQYKIQEVIKRRQVLLVQVVKEERGTKGAALTTYLSLAGRYCVLMPNTSRGGGVSRKIGNAQDRKRLKTVLSDLKMPSGMAVILRTAGAERSKAEIKRDFDYILKLWDDIRKRTLDATAPALIHEEANLIKRSIRDLYSKDIEEVLVAGDEAYKTAKSFMRALMPSHAKKVQPYKDEQGIPLFHRYQVEQQLAQIHEPQVQLRSGGTIVMHQTEALVAIDVNSGRATKERHIEETALKTNLEAAEEIARQLRLRDLAGLIVIDFIDMDDQRNANQVERKLKESLRRDRARIQVGRISAFGLMEMSRQRLRPSLIESMNQPCPTCGGIGYIASTETAALILLRTIEEEGLRKRSAMVRARVPVDVALYILNNKRAALGEMETHYGFRVVVEADPALLPPKYELSRTASDSDDAAETPIEEAGQSADSRERDGGKRRSRRGGRKRSGRDEPEAKESRDTQETQASEPAEAKGEADEDEDSRQSARDDEDGGKQDRGNRRRKRGRRGGRRRKRQEDGEAVADSEGGESPQTAASDDQDGDGRADAEASARAEDGDDQPEAPAKRSRGGSRRGRSRRKDADSPETADDQPTAEAETGAGQADSADSATDDADSGTAPAKTSRRRRAPRRSADKTAAETSEEAASTGETGGAADAEPAEKPAKTARGTRRRKSPAAAKPAEAEAPAEAESPAVAEKTAEPAEASAAPEVEPEAEPAAAADTGGAPAPESAESETSGSPLEPTSASTDLDRYVVSDGSESAEKTDNRRKKRGWWNRMLG